MIDDLEGFLYCAIQLESEAAETYAKLVAVMHQRRDPRMAALFETLEGYSRLHLAEVQAHAQEVTDGDLAAPQGFRWPDGRSPESPKEAMDSSEITPRRALELALGVERAACDFYSVVAGQSRSAEVQEMAQSFAEEESGHVDHLERWLERMED